jgi:hypothetical protein
MLTRTEDDSTEESYLVKEKSILKLTEIYSRHKDIVKLKELIGKI